MPRSGVLSRSQSWRYRLGAMLGPAMLLYRRSLRGLTLGARVLALDGAGRVFLVKHSYTPGWYLPGGGVEPGETALDALAREAWEEGRLRFDAAPRLFALYHNARTSMRDHIALYVAESVSQPEPPRPDAEIADHVWVPWTDLPADATPATRRRIDEVLRGLPPSQTW